MGNGGVGVGGNVRIVRIKKWIHSYLAKLLVFVARCVATQQLDEPTAHPFLFFRHAQEERSCRGTC